MFVQVVVEYDDINIGIRSNLSRQSTDIMAFFSAHYESLSYYYYNRDAMDGTSEGFSEYTHTHTHAFGRDPKTQYSGIGTDRRILVDEKPIELFPSTRYDIIFMPGIASTTCTPPPIHPPDPLATNRLIERRLYT